MTNLLETEDETMLRDAARGFLADGALLKTGHLLQANYFPNMVVIIRDIAHTVRPA